MPRDQQEHRPRRVALKRRGKPTGAVVFLHPCSVCGSPNAPYGVGVNLRHKKPGSWYCAKHLPEQSKMSF